MSGAHAIQDPETGHWFYPIGCGGCGKATWWVCSASTEPDRVFRVALVCTSCGRNTKGFIVMNERTLTPAELGKLPWDED